MKSIGFANPFSRKYPRHKTDFYINKIIDDELHMTRVRDISATGMYLTKLIEPDRHVDEIGLEMVLPGTDEVIWAAGRVVRTTDKDGITGSAINFTRISEHHKQMIADYVEAGRGRRFEDVLKSA